MRSLALAQQGGDGFAGASVSIRFADQVDVWGAAGLAFQDITTQSLTATGSASVAFQGVVGVSKSETAWASVGLAFQGIQESQSTTAFASASIVFQNETQLVPHFVEQAVSPSVSVGFESPGLPTPTITSVSHGSGVQGTSISDFTIIGTNFDRSSTLFFTGIGVLVSSYTSRTSTELVANVSIGRDAATTARDVVVLNPDLQQAAVPGGFQVVPAPSLLFSISTGGTTFPQGAIVPFTAIVFNASAADVPLTSSSLAVRLTVKDPTSAVILGPTPLSFSASTGQFTGTLNTSGLTLGRYLGTFTFSRLDGTVLADRSASFDLVGSVSLSLASNKPAYGRGESVGLTGHAQDPSGAPLVGAAVALTITLGNVTREYSVFSNAQGNYGFVFTPPLTEAGTYTATARSLSGGASSEAATTFTVHGLMLDPASTTVDMSMSSTVEVPLRLRNIGETVLSILTLAVQDPNAEDGITGTLNVTSLLALPPGVTQDLTLSLTAPAGTAPSHPVSLKVLAIAVADVVVVDRASISISLRDAAGTAVVDPPAAAVGLRPGASRLLEFTLRNEGVTPIVNAQARVHDATAFNWVAVENQDLGSLAPGESRQFGVSLLPPADLAPGAYAIAIDLATGLGTVVVPINVEITPSLVRPVLLQVSDDAARDVSGASVQLVSQRLLANGASSGTDSNQIYQGTTDSSGRLTFAAVAAGTYTLRVLAAQHADYEAEVTIEPGASPQEIEAILSTTVVSFSFKVTPTAITDRYDVALVVTYSTDLVKPALVVSPARIDVSLLRGERLPEPVTIIVTNSHAQATVTDIRIDARGLGLANRLPTELFCLEPQPAPCNRTETGLILVSALGPGMSVKIGFTAELVGPEDEPPSQPLGSVSVTGNYVYSLRGLAKEGHTDSQVLVMYVKPEALRMFPPIEFVNDETAGTPGVFRYLGTTTRITIENARPTPLDFKDFDGQPTIGPTSTPTVKALQLALPANILPDQVPVDLLTPLAQTPLWEGDLTSNRLDGLRSQTSFDIREWVNDLVSGEDQARRDRLISRPPYMAVVGQWGNAAQPEGFVFPTSVMTIRPREVSVVQSGWSPCLCGPGGTTILGGTAPPQPFNNHGIVKIQIDQRVSLEREAFTATLGIVPAVASLDNFDATLSILGTDGTDATDKFVVITTLPGSPILGPAEASWLIIPKVSAGGTTAAGLAYTATAHIAYSVRGVPATFDTAPESFTVLPLPKLTLTYTIPYVIMDNIPFELTVDVANAVNAGTANKVRIESAQPRIVENVNRVDVHFTINSNPIVDLGTIAPGQTKSGSWVMESTRRGFIIDFAANLSQRTFKGKVLDPVIERVNLQFQPALGGSAAVTGCDLGPVTLRLTRGADSLAPVLGPNDSYYFPRIGSPVPFPSAPGSVRYVLTLSQKASPIVARDVDVVTEQPTDFVDVSASNLEFESHYNGIPDCWALKYGLDPDDPSLADRVPAISSVRPRLGVQGTTLSDFIVIGSNFQPNLELSFSGTGITANVRVSSVTPTRLEATVHIEPDAASGLRDVTLTTTAQRSQQGTLPRAFQVLHAVSQPEPTIVHGTFDPDRPTVVLAHGWQPEDDKADVVLRNELTSLWTDHAKTLIEAQPTNVNIVQFVWPEAFTMNIVDLTTNERLHDEYREARWYVFDAGIRLGNELLRRFPPFYDKPVHFIGHSLGSIVNAFAAWRFLGDRPHIRTAQLTVLDRPDNVDILVPIASSTDKEWFRTTFGFDKDYIASTLNNINGERLNKLAIVVDNYFSTTGVGVGDEARGTTAVPVYNHEALINPGRVGVVLREGLTNDHSGVHQWYRWTVDPNNANFVGAPYCDDEGLIVGVLLSLSLDASLNPCENGWFWSLFGPAVKGRDGLPGLPMNSDLGTGRATPLTLDNFVNEHGCELKLYPAGGQTIECRQQSAALAQAELDIPPSALYLSFSYRFPNVGDADWAVLYVDDEPVWTLAAPTYSGSGFVNSGPIPIKGLTGRRTLTVALYDAGVANAELQVREFTSLAANLRPIAVAGGDQFLEATSSAGAVATLDGSLSGDPDGDPLTFTWTGPFGEIGGPIITPALAMGTHTITLAVSDNTGNSATDMVVVTVGDRTPPDLTLPSDMTLEATGPSGSIATFTATATDNVDGGVPVTCWPASGLGFPLGDTTVRCSATDAAGNIGDGDFRITVRDTTPPAIAPRGDSVFEATGPSGGMLVYLDVTTVDTVDGDGFASCVPGSGTTFPIATTTVTCTATDRHGNTAVPMTFTITVRDTTPPSLTVPLALTLEATEPAGAMASFEATATDLVDGAVAPTCTPASGTTFPMGVTVVNCTATDAYGNMAYESFTVTVTPPSTTGRTQGEGHVDGSEERRRFHFKVREKVVGTEAGSLDYEVHRKKAKDDQVEDLDRDDSERKHHDRKDRFRSTLVTSVNFFNAEDSSPGKLPRSGIDEVSFTGVGSWNGEPGYTFEAVALDAGEPGKGRDWFTLTIRDGSGQVAATVDGVLTDGNIQSRKP